MRRIFLFVCLFSLFSICTVSGHATDALGTSDNTDSLNFVSDVIQNGSFEADTDSDGVPDFWRIPSPGGRDCLEAHSGACSLMIPGGHLPKAKQKIAVAGSVGDYYSFDFWCKVSGAKIYQVVNVKVKFKCTDGTSDISGYFFKPRRPIDWIGPLGFGVTADCDYTSITIWLWYHASSGAAWFDDVSLHSGLGSNESDINTVVAESPTEIQQQ